MYKEFDWRELTDQRFRDYNKMLLGKSVEEAEQQYPDIVIRVLSKTESITLEACYNRVNVYINNGIIDRVVRFG